MRQYAKPALPPPLPVAPDSLASPSAGQAQPGQRQALAASRWPARLDLLQGISGLALALFLIAHIDRKSTHLNSSHGTLSRMPASA